MGEIETVTVRLDIAERVLAHIAQAIDSDAAKAISDACSLGRLNALCAPMAHVILAAKPPEWLDRLALPRSRDRKENYHA